jgi:hypothetical protein
MAIELFGFRIGKTEEEIEKKAVSVPSFAPPPNTDGALEVAPGGAYGTYVDLEGVSKNEGELVTRYREMSMYPECESAIDDVINEAIITDDERDPVSINLEKLKQPESVKRRIEEEFKTVLDLLDFHNMAYDIFRRWYIDGRLFYHIMIDNKSPRMGIQELRYIDPRRIRKVRQPMKRTPIVGQNSKLIVPAYEEYYLYNLAGMATGTMTQGVKISKDAICYVHSGNLDARNRMVLSHLHKAIKPLNQLRMLEDAVVIYRLARAPERRIFYIDVGNLPKAKAEQYVRDMMVRHKNRLVYDADTGAVKDARKFMTMLEDYWLPRREGGRGTEITTLPGGENLGQMDDVEYFRKKLYKSLSVPISRLEPDGQFSLGRGSEISRDEIKFAKFIERLRDRFSHLFDHLLEIQLLLTGVMTREEWKEMKNDINYSFQRDNYYAEIKEQDMLNNRLSVLGVVDAYVGKYYSTEWVRKNVLRQSEEDMREIDAQIAAEPDTAQDEMAAQQQNHDQEMQQTQQQMAMKDMDIKAKELEAKAAALKKPEAKPAAEAKPKAQKIEIKLTGDKKGTVKKEEFTPKPLSEEDRRLIENMTRAIEKVSKEDIEEVEEIRDDL